MTSEFLVLKLPHSFYLARPPSIGIFLKISRHFVLRLPFESELSAPPEDIFLPVFRLVPHEMQMTAAALLISSWQFGHAFCASAGAAAAADATGFAGAGFAAPSVPCGWLFRTVRLGFAAALAMITVAPHSGHSASSPIQSSSAVQDALQLLHFDKKLIF
jgi:hypothetical protein